ncbi:MAG: hypothetical protein H6899_11585 [Rhodobacter sp.]|nr:hypothetical protein [Rhodobacter sp.]
MIEISRHNPWFRLVHRRSMTEDEVNRRIPREFWSVYGAAAYLGQAIGLCFVAGGLVALAISLAKKFI